MFGRKWTDTQWEAVRADAIQVGDAVAFHGVKQWTVEVGFVTDVDIIGDDVEITGQTDVFTPFSFSTSEGNVVMRKVE